VTPTFIWLAASAGALSLLTPCVFPMIPITVSYFTYHRAADRRGALRHAALFGLGIVATFTALGLALAVLVGATGVALLAANPWVNLALTTLFVAFALNLFGVYHVAVPSAVLTALDGAARRWGAAGRAVRIGSALLMGLTFTLTSFTCTAPFVGTVLVTAAHGEWRQPIIGMLVYSTVFAIPFCVLAVAPQWLSRVPRAGGWLQGIKVVMGFVELAAAMKFLSNADLVWRWGVFTRSVVLASWAVLAVLAAAYVWGWLPIPERWPATPRSAGRTAAGLAALATGLWLATGLTGRPLGELESFLPPAGAEFVPWYWTARGSAGGVPVSLSWRLNDYPGALAEAKQAGKRVFIDFTGYTCTNCRWMEANMFTRPDVKAGLNHYVLSRLFTDGEGALYERQQAFQQARFNTVALPLYAIVDADGRTVASLAGLTRDPAAFVAFLREGSSGN
jgi:thiol:disulfide interchange protein